LTTKHESEIHKECCASENPSISSLFSKLFNRIPKFWPNKDNETEPVVGEFVTAMDDTLDIS
jgi:hypothetical protein